jgi:hypothetical protein
MLRHLQRVSCAFFGHQYWLGRGSDRLFLKCAACGHETAGVRMGAETEAPKGAWWRRGLRRAAKPAALLSDRN